MTIPRIPGYDMPSDLPVCTRVAWQPDPARAVLLIHDLQQYFVDFFNPQTAPITELIRHTQALRQACDDAQIPVIYTAQPPQQTAQQRGLLQDWWGSGITGQVEGARIIEALAPRPQDLVLTKWRYSAFTHTDLRDRLKAQGRDQLIICGVYAHIGCLMTASDAFMHDIQPFLVGDAVADFSLQDHHMALTYVTHRCGVVLDHQQVISRLKQHTAVPASYEALLQKVAAVLQLPANEIHPDDDLLLCGLDSVRLMSLVALWQAAGAPIEFVTLAEKPTLADWWFLLSGCRVNEQTPALELA